ncbi:MAG: hypothetical protein NC489_18175 [Ruminococcus flavefaciens]|nr:hypothetical protein [Ruminococcus flavefaciens]
MNYLCRAGAYLNSVTATVNSMCGMVLSDELRNNIEAQFKISVTLIELEQATADFITDMELDVELPQAVSISKRKFIGINERLIKHLEKIQLQGYRFDELLTTLKLENGTLKEEINFL